MDPKTVARRFFAEQDRLRGGPPDELCGEGYAFRAGTFPAMDLAGHTAFAETFYAAFPDLRHDVEDVFSDGANVAVRFRLKGTNAGEFMGAPATGKPVDVGAIALMTVDGSKVVEIRAEFDQLGLMQQLGFVPA